MFAEPYFAVFRNYMRDNKDVLEEIFWSERREINRGRIGCYDAKWDDELEKKYFDRYYQDL